MATKSDKVIIVYPQNPTDIVTIPTISAAQYRLNSATDYVCAITDAPRDLEIDKIKFKTGTQTTGCVIEVRIETVVSGLPSGTLWDTNTSGTIGGTSAASTEYEVALTANAVIDQGETFAIVLRVASGTPALLNINAFNDAGLPFFPYIIEYDGSPTIIADYAPMYAISDATDGYIQMLGFFPANSFTTRTVSSSSTPDVIGNRFILETPKKCKGFWVWGDVDQTTTVRILDSDGSTVLATKSMNVDTPPSASAGLHWRFFDADIDLQAGKYYYLTFEPDSTSNFTGYTQDVSDVKYMPSCMGAGDFKYISAKNPTNAASYTVTDTSVLFAGLLLSGSGDGTFMSGSMI